MLNQSGKGAKLGTMRRLVLLILWALGLVLLLTRVASADDTIEALRRAEREARANLADAHGNLLKERAAAQIRLQPLQPPQFPPVPENQTPGPLETAEKAAREAESRARQAAEARRAAEAKSIDNANAATEARERAERAADRAKDAAKRSEFLPERKTLDDLVGKELRQFDAEQARRDFKSALERETELLDKEADRLEAEAKKPGASAETKAAATRAREAADRAAAHLRAKFPPLFPPKRATIDPFPYIPEFPTPGDPTAFGTGGQQVSTNMTVAMDNRLKVLICLRHGADPAKVAAALGLGPYGVIAMTATGTILLAPGDPQALAAKAQGHPDVCFVETNYCMIMTPLTAFRGHVHELHRGRLHDHDAPDPPWSWSLTPPEPVVSWGGQ